MSTLIHLIAQRVLGSGGARADWDVGVFGYAYVALVEYPCCRNGFGGEGRGGKGEKGKDGGGRGEKEVGGLVFGGEGCDRVGFGGEGRVVLEGPWGW